MGSTLSTCSCRRHKIGSLREITLLMIGLDNAGKTCTAKHLLGEPTQDAVPTVGFSSVQVRHGKYNVCVYDIGGGPKIRGIWKNYYALVHGVIFVVDSSEPLRFEECKQEIRTVVMDNRISGKPILLFFNKQDLDDAISEMELVIQLELETLVNEYRCPTRVEGTCAIYSNAKVKDPGIDNGFNWLIGHIAKEFAALKVRVDQERAAQLAHEEKDRLERLERVQRIREERERAQKEMADVDSSRNPKPCSYDDDNDVIIGNPFKSMSVIRAELKQKMQDKNEQSLGVTSVPGITIVQVSPTNSSGDNEITILEPHASFSEESHPSQSEIQTTTESSEFRQSTATFMPCNSVAKREKTRKTKKRFKNRIAPQVAKPTVSVQSTSCDLPPLKSPFEIMNGNVAVYHTPKRASNGSANFANDGC